MVIGIDLGTTYSVAAYVKDGKPCVIPNRDGTNTLPSVVMFEDGKAIVGAKAKANAVNDPYNAVQFVKRHIGTKHEFYIVDDDDNETVHSPESITAVILKRIREDCEKYLNEKVTGAVITVPAYFTDAQKDATIAAGKIADLDVMKVIHEPTAAALAYGLDKSKESSLILIYDLGGGTFDVTAAEVKGKDIDVRATHGYRQLGGFDFDNKLIEDASKQINAKLQVDIFDMGYEKELQMLRENCEKAKISLSTHTEVSFTLDVGEEKVEINFTRAQFNALIMPFLEHTGDSIDVVLEEGMINKNEIKKVLLVGGSSQIPVIGDFIYEKLGIRPSSEVNPHEVVALGAALHAYYLSGGDHNVDNEDSSESQSSQHVESFSIKDRNAHAFGIRVRDMETGREINSVIIQRNQPLMKPFVKVYSSSRDQQEKLTLKVTEGESTNLELVTIIGEAQIKLNPHPKGASIAVEFMYDNNGIITGRIYDLFGVSYSEDENGYLIGDIATLDGALFIAEVSIKREFALSDDDIASEQRKLQLLSIE